MAQLVAGKYQLRTPIGRGPHGLLWRARHEGTLEECAIKVLSSEFADDPTVVSRFIGEQNVLTAYLHPGYVRVRELAVETGRVAIVTELVTGMDLRQELTQSGPLPPDTATQIAAACLDAIAAGHHVGVVHCDIKPSNIIVASSGDVRVTDCRVARLARGRRNGSQRFADERYAAPEIVQGGYPLPATDIYGLGLVLHDMITGTPPVAAKHAPSGSSHDRPPLPPTVDSELRDIVEACLAEDPAQRPTGEWLAAELRRASLRLARSRPATEESTALAIPRTKVVDARIPQRERTPHTDRVTREDRVTRRDLVPYRDPVPYRDHAVGERRHGRAVAMGAAAVTLGLAIAYAITGGLLPSRSDHPTGDHSPAADRGGRTSLATAASAPATGMPLPGSAAVQTGPGALAFVQYWFDTLGYAAATGDTGPVTEASSASCAPCTTAIQTVAEAYAGGGSMRGGGYKVHSVNLDSFFDLRRPILRVVFDRSPRATLDAGGREVDTLAEVTFASCQIVLVPEGARWRVVDAQSTTPVA